MSVIKSKRKVSEMEFLRIKKSQVRWLTRTALKAA